MKKMFSALMLIVCLSLATVAFADNVFRFQEKKVSIFEGEQIQVPLLREGTAEEGTPVFKTASQKLLSVDEDGMVTGISKGNGKITATLKTDKRTFTAELTVSVLRRVSEVTVDEKALTVYDPSDPVVEPYLKENTGNPVILLRVGANSQRVNMSALPTDASNRATAIRSLDEKIVQIAGDNKNYLRPINAGECEIEAYSVQNPEVSVPYHVLVVQPVQKIRVEADATVVSTGGAVQAYATLSPDNATVREVVWTSTNPKAATVDQNGVVTGVDRGETYIRATAADGSGCYHAVKIVVEQQPESITLKKDRLTVNVKRTVATGYTVEPKNANNKKVVWSSSDESIATVDGNGNIRGVKAGTCVITCASKIAPDVAAYAEVTVLQPATRIQFTRNPIDIDVGTSTTVNWIVEPEDVSDNTVKLYSSNDKVATVTDNGLVYGLKRGTVTLKAAAQDGSKVYGTMKLNVNQPVTGVHMKYDTLHVDVDSDLIATAVLEPADASNVNMTWTSADPSILTLGGTTNRVKLRGHAWGTTTITGTTEDGGYTTTATVKVGNYDKAVRINDLYIQNNKIKITLQNVSNMNIEKVYFTIECYDVYGDPTLCCTDGGTNFSGSYRLELMPGDCTQHGRFTFTDFVQPPDLHGVRMRITGYITDEDYRRNIAEDKQPVAEYFTQLMTKPIPVPEPDLG